MLINNVEIALGKKKQITTRITTTGRNMIISKWSIIKENISKRRKNTEKEYANNFAKDVIYYELFIAKNSNQKHDGENFIVDSGATSHMVKL